MRRISVAAGAYAPGIHERYFQLIERTGSDIEFVDNWLRQYRSKLADQGYNILSRRVAAKSLELIDWVEEGLGFRGAVLTTTGRVIHPTMRHDRNHAVALTTDRKNKRVVIEDPWPSVDSATKAQPRELDRARRDHKFAALVLYWTGHA